MTRIFLFIFIAISSLVIFLIVSHVPVIQQIILVRLNSSEKIATKVFVVGSKIHGKF